MRRFLLIMVCCAAAMAADGVLVKELWFKRSERGYALQARMLIMNEELIRQLLQSGYAVQLKFDLRLMQNRDWLPDRELGDIVWQPMIVFNSLLNRYSFSAGGVVEEFGELSAVLRRAEKLQSAPEASARLAEIINHPEVYLIARYEILIDHLPQPLQVSLLTAEGDISSGWRRFMAETRE